MTYKYLLFDLGGVLVDLDFKRSIEAFMELGCPPELFQGEFWSAGIFKEVDRGTISVEAFYDEIRRIGHLPHVSNDDIMKAWNQIIAGVPERVFKALIKAREQGPIYLLSNVGALHWDLCHQTIMRYTGEDALNWFEKTFASFELHLLKPEAAIYRHVIQETGLRPEDILFIDDRQENLDAAAAEGFQVLLSTDHDWIDHLGFGQS